MDKFNQETDMGYITQVVQAVANALVMSTEFPKQISDMKADLASLHTDLETTKGRNAELDALLHDTRRQRDEAEQALSQVKNELAISQNGHKAAGDYAVELEQQISSLKTKLKATETDRDKALDDQISAEERAKLAEAKLAKLAEALGLPQAEAKSEPEPTPKAPEPILPEPPKRIYADEYNYYTHSEGKPEHWDSERKQYYVEA